MSDEAAEKAVGANENEETGEQNANEDVENGEPTKEPKKFSVNRVKFVPGLTDPSEDTTSNDSNEPSSPSSPDMQPKSPTTPEHFTYGYATNEAIPMTIFYRSQHSQGHGGKQRPTLQELRKGLENDKNYNKQMKVPYVIYADFEALVRKIPGCERSPENKQKSYTEKTEKHEACGFSYTVVRSDGKSTRPFVYRGENAVEVFLKHLLNEEKRIRSSLKIQKPLLMTAKDWKEHKNATSCHICNKSLIRDSFFDSFPVWDHDKGKFRGSAHNACNLKLRINPKTDQIPVVFHNLRGYDAHHLMQAMSKLPLASKKEVKCGANNMEVKCVANNMEKYITFSLGGLRFIDSLNFLQGSLDSLGIYPYEYMDSWERFNETSLPEKEKFYSKPNDEHITDEEYEHANSVWKTFGCKTLGDYHDLYVETDVTLLADVFENFRKTCKEKYELDPAHYFTSPGLSWDALLKKTGVQLELLTDYDMHLFVERGIRGGISMVSKRYAETNNPYVEGYDDKKPKKYIMYLDANNLYGWAMSKPLPKSGFRWKRVMPTEKEIMRKNEFEKTGWILEVDLEYPAELHEEHNSYPLAPEKKKINKDLFSPYQKKLIKDLDLDPPDCEKLVLTLEDKTNYVVHYRNLQFYLKQGMKLKKVHRVLEFEQECWMEPYIRMNTEFRKKAKNDFEKNFYKLMNNSVFGKTMENLRNRVDIKIVRSDENNKIRKLVASPLYSRHFLFSNDLVGIEMRKSLLFLNKPVYTGMTILDNSKILMYDFFYNHLKKKYGSRCELLYTDTDSLLVEIETEEVYEDMSVDKEKYDTGDYPKDHPLFCDKNKKVLGKMKDECAGTPIAECVCLRPKMYSILTEDQKK
ncbi:hypothetical protein ACROYT_G026547 [Oculina patagonica]